MAGIRKRQAQVVSDSTEANFQQSGKQDGAWRGYDAPNPLSRSIGQGLMVILAVMGWPSVYPKPESRVTTTVYD